MAKYKVVFESTGHRLLWDGYNAVIERADGEDTLGVMRWKRESFVYASDPTTARSSIQVFMNNIAKSLKACDDNSKVTKAAWPASENN